MDRYQKLIPLKWTLNPFPSAVIENNITLTKPEEIAYTFKKYFLNISNKSQSTIKFSRNKFHEFLPDIDINSFFIDPVNEKHPVCFVSQSSKRCFPKHYCKKILK